jgi:molecular chaperone HscB
MQTTEGISTQANCWSCGSQLRGGEPFCAQCGKVQPPREPTYFAVFGLPPRLQLDLSGLEKQFYRLSRKLHPDVHAQASPQQQQWSLAQASLLNDAYRTLKNPVERTKYLLRLEGVQLEDAREAEGQNNSKVPPDLLEEVFDLNMQLEELRQNRRMGEDDPQLRSGLEQAKSQFAGQLKSVDNEMQSQWVAWDQAWEENDASKKTVAKEAMTALLQRRSYLQNLLRDVEETLEGS